MMEKKHAGNLLCSLRPKVEIDWSKFLPDLFLFYRYTLSGGRLTIQNPKVGEDEDFYRCTVENDQGKIMSKVAQIMFGCK